MNLIEQYNSRLALSNNDSTAVKENPTPSNDHMARVQEHFRRQLFAGVAEDLSLLSNHSIRAAILTVISTYDA